MYHLNSNVMKRIVLLLAFVVITAANQDMAQTLDSIPHHNKGIYGPEQISQWEGIAQLKDGSILCNQCVGIYHGEVVVGNVFYRISRHGAVILDTLLLEDPDPPFYSFVSNPNGNGNLRLGIKHDSLAENSTLQILPFDDDLVFDSLNEVVFPLSGARAFSFPNSGIITRNGDLLLVYSSFDTENSRDFHFVRFGLDGTLKHENVIPDDSLLFLGVSDYGVFNESPLEYYVYGRNEKPNGTASLNCYVFDYLFQPKELITINPVNQHFHFKYNFGWMDRMIVNGNDLIVASRYEQGAKNGVCVVSYDKHTREEKNVAFFESKPMVNSSLYGAYPIGVGLDTEGSVCLSYNTQQPLSTDKSRVAVAKMDTDLNVMWQRFCLEPEGYHHKGGLMTVLDDGGVAVCGTNLGSPDIFFLILSDDGWAVNESEVSFRPYAYYPNPVQDELHLQYSPDVTPSQIELYDLQGRLVRTQRNGLERLEMNGLPSGTYTMRVTLEGGKVFSDKVVKE